MASRPSLKALAAVTQTPAAPPQGEAAAAPSYRTAATRADTRQVSGHFPASDVQAFRIMAEEQDKDVGEMLAEAINMAFERYGKPNRIQMVSGRRKRF